MSEILEYYLTQFVNILIDRHVLMVQFQVRYDR